MHAHPHEARGGAVVPVARFIFRAVGRVSPHPMLDGKLILPALLCAAGVVACTALFAPVVSHHEHERTSSRRNIALFGATAAMVYVALWMSSTSAVRPAVLDLDAFPVEALQNIQVGDPGF